MSPRPFPQPPLSFLPTRRSLLAGAACAAWTTLLSPWSLANAPRINPHTRAKSVILIFNCGGPSHIDI